MSADNPFIIIMVILGLLWFVLVLKILVLKTHTRHNDPPALTGKIKRVDVKDGIIYDSDNFDLVSETVIFYKGHTTYDHFWVPSSYGHWYLYRHKTKPNYYSDTYLAYNIGKDEAIFVYEYPTYNREGGIVVTHKTYMTHECAFGPSPKMEVF
jgi:hypothetical protein